MDPNEAGYHPRLSDSTTSFVTTTYKNVSCLNMLKQLSISSQFVVWNEQRQISSIWHLDLHNLSGHNTPRNSKVEMLQAWADDELGATQRQNTKQIRLVLVTGPALFLHLELVLVALMAAMALMGLLGLGAVM